MWSGHYSWVAQFGLKWFDTSALNVVIDFAEIAEEGRIFQSLMVFGKNEFAYTSVLAWDRWNCFPCPLVLSWILGVMYFLWSISRVPLIIL